MSSEPTLREEMEPEAAAEAVRARKLAKTDRRWSRLHIGAAGFLAVLLLVVAAAAAVRFGVLTEPGRAAVARLLEGRKVGRLGRLHVEGLTGDVFSGFGVRRLAIVDAKGAWVEATNVSLRWRPYELIGRRFHAERLRAEVLRVERRPEVEPTGPPGGGGLPVSILLDDVRLRLETRPAFSVREGIWDVAGEARIRRNGGASGRLDAQSRLHAGDGVAALFRVEPKGRMDVRIDAVEGAGGALAGSLGLPADQRFFVRGRVQGTSEDAGAVDFVAESGGRQPFRAAGGWNAGGANLQARLALDASRLTAGYARRIGPEVRLALTAKPTDGDGVYQLDAALRGRDAALSAKGPVDWRRRRTRGLAVDVTTTEFRRWLDDLNAGRTRATGEISGDLSKWRFDGRAEMEAVDQWGYRLARATGPTQLDVARDEIRLRTELTTVGGSGEGMLPFLLGPSPKVELDGSRLRGGRILIRSAHVAAPGFELTADGDRSIFGVLSLKGAASVTQLERAHPGAAGVVKANWTARQQGQDPWRISADARGEALATGFPEVDRLLGQTPQLTLEGTYRDGLHVARADLTGAATRATFTGLVDASAMVDLAVDWRASGPFVVGPFEVAGEAVGDGRVTGRALSPLVDLNAELASVDFGRLAVRPARLALQVALGDEMTGRAAVSGPTEWGQGRAETRFRMAGDGVDLTEISADAGGVRVTGAVSLRGGAPSTADLDFAVGPGAFLSEGQLSGAVKIVDRGGGTTADITMDGQRLLAPGMPAGLRSLRLRASGPFERLPFELSAQGEGPVRWRFAGDGRLDQSGTGAALVRELTLTGAGRVQQAEVRTLEPMRVHLAEGFTTVRLRMGVGAGRAELDARRRGDTLEADAEVGGVELASFANAYMGRLTANLRLNGRGERLDGTLDAAVEGGRDRDASAAEALSAKVRAVLADSRVRIDASATNPQGLSAKLDLDVPAEATAAPFRVALVRNQPVSGAFDAEGELRPLWDLFAGGSRTMTGRGTVQAKLAGTLGSLQPTGHATLENGRFQDGGTGFDVRNLAVEATFDRDSVDVRRFTGEDGHGGRASGSGEVSLAPGGMSTFTADLKGFRLIDNDLARASASGKVTVTRDAEGKARLTGGLVVDRADITANPPVPTGVVPLEVIEVNRPGAEDDQPLRRPAVGGPQIAVDVNIDARRGVFIRGNGLDIELSLDAHVGGTIAAPVLTGEARVVRGDYQFAGKRFEFDDQGTIRLASTAEGVRLNLTATREDPTLRAIVRIQGSAARPEITLSSVPVLPQDEVLSQVLFGRSASQLSPLEAAQLASAVTGLATGGGFDVLGNLRQFARLDRLAVSGGSAGSATTVSGGKYLTDDVYLELTGGGRRGPTVQVEWRLRRNLSVVSTVGTQGDARLSVRLRRNY